jgi:dynein heavy chain 1
MDESFAKFDGTEAMGEDVDPKHEALISAIVNIHKSVKNANTKLAKNAKKYNFITPRDYLDFIRHFTDVLTVKKEQLQEQELHLNTGLDKLKETEEEVINLQQNVLVHIQKDLEIKEKEANKKLTLMVEEQNNAEKSKEVSIKTSEEVKKMQIQIAERQEIVNNDLGKAEPALIEAQESVNSISSAHLNEIKSMLKPPDKVRCAVEAVCILILGLSAKPDWKECRGYIAKTDFIPTVLNFDKDSVSEKTKKFINTNYLQNSETWNLDAIFKASKAAGPLAKWVQSLIEYADIFLKIEPLRKELNEIQEKERELVEQSESLTSKISELEHNIEQYKKDYAILITEVERIKSEMEKVTNKVERSKQLIQNLSSERIRWDSSCQDIKNQMASLIGDCCISGAFLTYYGFFDHSYRIFLNAEWKNIFTTSGIIFKDDLSYMEFLSKPSERLSWQSKGLPNDDICIENATIFKYYNRYPLIIDPSEQALEFILNNYADQKIQKTSFVDDAFMKQLESSIRFGYPLLVQDVEKYDPILNSVLNKEIHKANGRVLIRVGDQDIDFSPSFKMFMITRDSQAQFTPDLCSRVTFCNFTVTPSSLQNQCLNIYLKNERPEIEQKRQDLLKLQGECRVKLRELEDKLLNTLSTFEGSILENDQLIATLETIKKESIEISKKVEATDETMNEIQLVSDIYLPLSVITSRIFFTLESMPSIHYLYQYSLERFMDTIYDLIKANKDINVISKKDPDNRLRLISDMIFEIIYQEISPSLLQQDKSLFGLRLTQIKMEHRGTAEFDILMKTPTVMELGISSGLIGGSLSENQLAYIQYLNEQKQFSYLVDHIEGNEDVWKFFLSDPNAESNVPTLPEDDELLEQDPDTLFLRRLILIKILRPDRFSAALKTFIHKVLQRDILDHQEMDFGTAVTEKISAKSPLLLVSAPGYDASNKVEELAKVNNKKLFSIAIGAAE